MLCQAGEDDEAAAELRLATEAAKDNRYTLNTVLLALASAGLDEQVDALSDPLLASLSDSTREADLVSLGGTAALAGRDDTLRAIESRLDADARRRMVARCAEAAALALRLSKEAQGAEHHGADFAISLADLSRDRAWAAVLVLPDSARASVLATVPTLEDQLITQDLEAQDLLPALGGGVFGQLRQADAISLYGDQSGNDGIGALGHVIGGARGGTTCSFRSPEAWRRQSNYVIETAW